MTKQDIIDNKIAQLSGQPFIELTSEEEQYIDSDPELKAHLQFLESFWQEDAIKQSEPSKSLDAGFYSMLASATAKTTTKHQEPSVLEKIAQLWRWQTFGQVAALLAVFTFGWLLNKPSPGNEYQQQIQALDQQIASLSTLLAVSMMQRPSASERLAGVAFLQNANLQHEQLSNLLLSTLKKDSATPVKLAVINTLTRAPISHLEEPLTDLVTNQDNVLVQIELIRLLLTKGSQQTQTHIIRLLSARDLHPDARAVIEQLTTNQTV